MCLFLDASAKLRKASMSLVMSACPSVRMEQLGYHLTDFHEIWYFGIFRKNYRENSSFIKTEKNNEYFTWRPI